MKQIGFASLIVVLVATSASAQQQVAQPPPRVSRPVLGGGPPPNPDRARHDLELEATTLGGYDDNLNTITSRGVGAIRPSAYTAVGDVGLRYFVGNNTKGLDVQTRGFASAYRNVGKHPEYGGEASLGGRTSLGQNTNVSVSSTYQVAPYYSLGLFSGLPTARTGPTSNLANALFEGNSYISSTDASIDHDWTRRTTTRLRYRYGTRRLQDRSQLDNNSQGGALSIDRRLGRTMSLTGSYDYGEQDLNQAGRNGFVRQHSIDAGFKAEYQFTRTKTMTVSGGGGAHRTHSTGFQQVTQTYWKPNLYGTVSVDVGRSWTVSADFRQSSNVLPSPVFTPQSYFSHTVVLTAGGYIGPRLELVFDAANSNGHVATGLTPTGERASGAYWGYTGSGQLRIRITNWWSGIVSLSHFQSRLSGSAAEFLQTSPNMHRNSVRAGLAWNMPLYGGGRQARGGRRGAGGRGGD